MKQQALALNAVRLSGGFWQEKTRLVAEVMLPYQWNALNDQIPGAEPSHALENFRLAAGEAAGAFAGMVFQDSDVAKWLEAACYSLVNHPDAELEAQVEEAVRLIAAAQQGDGYIDTWVTLQAPDKRWTDLAWGHELYCGGHLIEAAVAHFRTTGKRHFLDVMMKYADCVIAEFGPGKPHGLDCCGHPEIELALMRLAEASGQPRFAELAEHFLDVRGRDPERFRDRRPLAFVFPPLTKAFEPDYFQGNAPLRDQRDADGHSVRAMYLYTALAQVWGLTGEPALKAALDRLWTSTVERRMYVTGSLGSQANGERFTIDWDLPSDTAYAETCASIGLIFWAREMLAADGDGRYADTIERVLYNGALSGVSLDGQRYFYVNPLESIPEVARARQDHEHVKTERVPWFGCSCCPPNIARLIASVTSLAYGRTADSLWVHQYMNCEADLELGGTAIHVSQETDFPWDGAVSLSLEAARTCRFSLRLRIPSWCRAYHCSVNGQAVPDEQDKSYLRIERDWSSGDRVELALDVETRFVRPHSRIAELAGKVAVMRGPLVYCAEELDNGSDLHNLLVDPAGSVGGKSLPQKTDSGVVLQLSGSREKEHTETLYCEYQPEDIGEAGQITLVPYYQWGNRQPGQEMRVWLRNAGTGRV
ncbi:MAG: hypothetical protein A2Z99_09200 [Treponema sp. GWB1_62_6]|nr:MAG: hypothetical protein A2001_12245 [Treponema sp. GWC1_61_84]OHE71978.1 MAG: hypothetical protein A2Z99_09200 [Treponema sp. GWB1_62_6]HCM26350.1 hypothetical protein [Treponema sp.]